MFVVICFLYEFNARTLSFMKICLHLYGTEVSLLYYRVVVEVRGYRN